MAFKKETGMTKKIVSLVEIKSRVAAELDKHPECAAVKDTYDVHWHGMEDECNWTVELYANGRPEFQACESRIRDAIAKLRAEYNTFDPEA
jgi:hypothetical protein